MTEEKAQSADWKQVARRALNEAYDRAAWHGPNLKTALQDLTVEQAVYRPQPGRHNIWEIVLHTAYWTHAVAQRLLGRDTSFPEEGEDWFARPREESERALRQDLALLEAQQQKLRELVDKLEPEEFQKTVSKGSGTVFENILGIAFHHVYHAGQIRLLRLLAEFDSTEGGRLGIPVDSP